MYTRTPYVHFLNKGGISTRKQNYYSILLCIASSTLIKPVFFYVGFGLKLNRVSLFYYAKQKCY